MGDFGNENSDDEYGCLSEINNLFPRKGVVTLEYVSSVQIPLCKRDCVSGYHHLIEWLLRIHPKEYLTITGGVFPSVNFRKDSLTKTELNSQREPLILLNILISDDSVGLWYLLLAPQDPVGTLSQDAEETFWVLLRCTCVQSCLAPRLCLRGCTSLVDALIPGFLVLPLWVIQVYSKSSLMGPLSNM